MITLLMALFMVLYAMSMVNKTKFEALRLTLKQSFSGAILTGGSSILDHGAVSVQPDAGAVRPARARTRPCPRRSRRQRSRRTRGSRAPCRRTRAPHVRPSWSRSRSSRHAKAKVNSAIRARAPGGKRRRSSIAGGS